MIFDIELTLNRFALFKRIYRNKIQILFFRFAYWNDRIDTRINKSKKYAISFEINWHYNL